jgi:N-methylhydantoinase B/oxoprolinase/acetone carboxylase alpha subunit
MWAGIAAVRAGESRFLNLLVKYGHEVVRYCISQYLDAGEQAVDAEEIPARNYANGRSMNC